MEADSRTGRSARLRAALLSRWTLPALAAAAFGISLLVQHAVFPGLSWNRDEPVYLWHVDVLRAGQLSTTDGGHPDLFQPWLSAAREGTLFSQYTLGWPLVLLVGSLLGSTELGVAAGAALAVVGTRVLVHELLRDRVVATVAAAFMIASPIFAVQGGVHLNYLFTLGLGLMFVATLRRGFRMDRWGLLVTAGGLLGWVFLTRPYDAAVWGLIGALPLAIEHRQAVRRLARGAGWAAIGLVPLVGATLLLNRHLTGSPTEFPITVADPLDQFGFGTRRLMPGFGKIAYGKRLALESTGRNVYWLPFFLFGAHLGIVVAAVGAWRHRAQPTVRVLIGLGLAFPLAYFAFFGTHISSLTARLSGPIYYVPSYAPLCALMALAVVDLARRRPPVAIAVVVALVAITVPVTVSRLTVNHELSTANEPWARSLESLDGRALVVVSPPSYLLFVNPYSANGADLDARVLFASDSGPELIELVEEQSDRTAYLQRADLSVIDLLPSEHPRTPRVRLDPIEVLHGEVHLIGTVQPLEDAPATSIWVEVDHDLVSEIMPVTEAGPVDIDLTELALPEGLHTLDLFLGRGEDTASAEGSPQRRRTFYVRVEDGALTLLAPGTASQLIRRPGTARAAWEDALHLPALAVDPRVAASS